MSTELWARPIEDLAPDLRERRVSPVDLAESVLERIERHDDTLLGYARG